MQGWFAVRREKKIPMTIFLALALLYLGGWGAMFQARTLRWTYVEWTFFSLVYTASAVLVLAAFLLGVWTRVNFGKGLPRYLNAQEPLPGDDFVSVTGAKSDVEYGSRPTSNGSFYSEKVAFPSPTGPVPRFSDAYGSPTQGSPVRAPPRALQLVQAQNAGAPLQRMDSGRSVQSNNSAYSHTSQDSIGKKRWVIE
jgi:hypothetical protein